MQAARSERGFLSFAAIFSLLVAVVFVFLGLRLLPPYIGNFQLQGAVEDLARTATYSRMSETEIRGAVIARASEYGIDLQNNQVTVRATANSVGIAVQYTVQVDLLASQLELSFQPSAENRNIVAR